MRVGLLYADIQVSTELPELWELMEKEAAVIADTFNTEDINKISTIAAARQSYKSLGAEPSRYRPSAEALLRRIVSGKGLYSVNNVVNIINLISFRSGFSIGGYDPSSIKGDILLITGNAEDLYEGLGRGPLNITNLPVLRDELGAFGCPTSDSERTGIRLQSNACLWVFFDFGADASLQKTMEEAAGLLQQFAKGDNLEIKMLSV
jgi:DNA/RNA-binding domain of Phe-tRNA-synthetase-like protein